MSSGHLSSLPSRRRQLSEAVGLALVAVVLTVMFGRDLWRAVG